MPDVRALRVDWQKVSALIESGLGLHFPPPRWPDLERGLQHAAEELGLAGAARCAEHLLRTGLTPRELGALANHLTVGETHFFRDRGAFDLIRATLREAIEKRRGGVQRLRVWSAGCCTGEEPYSVAILLREMLPDLERWQVTITATDINARFLAKAAQGEFGPWSFRGVPGSIRARYFRPTTGGRYAIRADVKRMVAFTELNLAEDAYPSVLSATNAMDLVLCRNVLLYFAPARARQAIEQLCRALLPGASLVLGPNDIIPAKLPGIACSTGPGGVVFRREPAPPLPPPARQVEPAVAAVPPLVPAEEARSAPARGAPAPLAPLTPRECRQRARACADAGELHQALEWCDRWAAGTRNDPAAHYLSALVLTELGSAELARVALKRVVYLAPDHILAHVALGHLALAAGTHGEARRHFDNALRRLGKLPPDELVPDSDGMPAAKLARTLASIRPAAAPSA